MIKDISDWMYAQSRHVKFGELTIVIKLHNGEIRLVRKSITTTDIPKPKKAGADHEIDQ